MPMGGGLVKKAADYMVEAVSGVNYLYNKLGQLVSQGADAAALINPVVAAGKSFELGSDITTATPIAVAVSGVTFDLNGHRVYLSNGSDCNVFSVTGLGVKTFRLVHGQIDGNSANQASGHGVYISTDYQTWDSTHSLEDLRIRYVKEHGVYVTGDTRACVINNVNLEHIGKRGFSISGSDHDVSNCIVGFAGDSGWWIKGTSSRFVNCKAFASGANNTAHDRADWSLIGPDSSCYNSYTNCHAQDSRYEGWEAYNGARDSQFFGCQAHDVGVTAASPGFKIEGVGGGSGRCHDLAFNDCLALDANDGVMTDGFIVSGGSTCYNITFNQVEVRGGNSDGIESGGDNTLIQGGTFDTLGGYGIKITGGTGVKIGINTYRSCATGNYNDATTTTMLLSAWYQSVYGTNGISASGNHYGRLITAAAHIVVFEFKLPDNLVKLQSASLWCVPAATATMRLNFFGNLGGNGEAKTTHTINTADVENACTTDQIIKINIADAVLLAATANDLVGLTVQGDATNIPNLVICGLEIQYAT